MREKSGILSMRIVSMVLAALFAVMFLPACFEDDGDNPPDGGKKPADTVYQIAFDTGVAGLSIAVVTGKEGSSIAPPETPSREGYKFGGWLYEGEPFAFVKMPSQNIILTAKWNKIYTMTFDLDGGTGDIEPIVEAEGEHILPPAVDPTKPEYKFGGWFLDDEPYYFITMPSADTTLTAKWVQGNTITFNTGVAGVTVAPLIAYAGAPILEPEPPKRAGYHFDGWFTGTGNNTRFIFTLMPAVDMVLTAKWNEATKLPSVNVTMHEKDGRVIALGGAGKEPPYPDRYLAATISVGAPNKGTGTGGINAVASEFKTRGYGSLFYGGNKKPYRIKFDKKQSLLGMSASKHWVLISNQHNNGDPTMLVTNTALALLRAEFKNIEYAPDSRIVDLYINNEYRGVYVLAEKYRVETGKVDIASEHGVEDTGYLLGLNWNSRNPGYTRFKLAGTDGKNLNRSPSGGDAHDLVVKSPDYDEIGVEPGVTRAGFDKQMAFIKRETAKLADAMRAKDYSTFSKLADVPSFVDSFIFWELYSNNDIAGGGYYIYKKSSAEGGKYYSGTPWDFDMTFMGNATDGFKVATATTANNANPFITYLWLMPEFQAQVKTRWAQLSSSVKTRIPQLWDAYINDAETADAIVRNFQKWGGNTSTVNSWKSTANSRKQWLLSRASRLDSLF